MDHKHSAVDQKIGKHTKKEHRKEKLAKVSESL
jgi:hypothetical protein